MKSRPLQNIPRQLSLLVLIGCIIFTSGCIKDAKKASSPEPNVPASESITCEISKLSVCSFNIQFLGSFKKKDHQTLSCILKDYDIVIIQELVAPPVQGMYPDGQSYSADPEAEDFLEAMQKKGFSYTLSEEDTGTGDKIHLASTATEWWIIFYKPQVVQYATDLPHGFLAEDRSNNDHFERVPYAFPFRAADNHLDFVLVSVHLQPGDSRSDQVRRKAELSAVKQWIDENDQQEKDFIILGDMNIEDHAELCFDIPTEYISLNDECRTTNTSPNSPKPYDHICYCPHYTTEIDSVYDVVVINLIATVKPYWNSTTEVFPGDPYIHDQFRQYYSDHNPIVFKMNVPEQDDD